MERTISEEGKKYFLKEDESILKEYPPHESKKAHSIAFNKAIAFPDTGFRNVILKNGNVLIVIRRHNRYEGYGRSKK